MHRVLGLWCFNTNTLFTVTHINVKWTNNIIAPFHQKIATHLTYSYVLVVGLLTFKLLMRNTIASPRLQYNLVAWGTTSLRLGPWLGKTENCEQVFPMNIEELMGLYSLQRDISSFVLNLHTFCYLNTFFCLTTYSWLMVGSNSYVIICTFPWLFHYSDLQFWHRNLRLGWWYSVAKVLSSSRPMF